MDSNKQNEGECILRLSGSTTVYLGDMQGELKRVANVNFAARYPNRDAANSEVARQRTHGWEFDVIPAPRHSGTSLAGFGGRRIPAAANF